MSFQSFVGNKLAVSMLTKALESGRIASAYLFHGPDGVGKSVAAREFAKALLCERGGAVSCDACSSCRRVDSGNHPDFHSYKPVGAMRLVRIDDVRQLISQAALKAFEGKWKIFVLLEADRMKVEAQNAVLKTLEEPPGQSVLILISSNPAGLLPTIVSRCQSVPFLPIEREELRKAVAEKWRLDDTRARLLASLACGSMGAASRLLQPGNLDRRTLLLNLLADAPRRSFREISSTVKAVEDKLKQKARDRSEQEEKRIRAMGNALSADDRKAREEEASASIASEVRQEIEDILNLLAFWHRDLLLIKQNAGADLVTNFDMIESLRSAASGITTTEILSRLRAVEDARRGIALNLPLPLCLEILYLSAGGSGTSKKKPQGARSGASRASQ